MVAALGRPVLERDGVGRAGRQVGEPQALHGCIALEVAGVVRLEVPVDPAAPEVPTAIAGEKDNTVLYHLRTGKKKKFRRMSGSGKVLDGCWDEMRSVSAG